MKMSISILSPHGHCQCLTKRQRASERQTADPADSDSDYSGRVHATTHHLTASNEPTLRRGTVLVVSTAAPPSK